MFFAHIPIWGQNHLTEKTFLFYDSIILPQGLVTLLQTKAHRCLSAHLLFPGYSARFSHTQKIWPTDLAPWNQEQRVGAEMNWIKPSVPPQESTIVKWSCLYEGWGVTQEDLLILSFWGWVLQRECSREAAKKDEWKQTGGRLGRTQPHWSSHISPGSKLWFPLQSSETINIGLCMLYWCYPPSSSRNSLVISVGRSSLPLKCSHPALSQHFLTVLHEGSSAPRDVTWTMTNSKTSTSPLRATVPLYLHSGPAIPVH